MTSGLGSSRPSVCMVLNEEMKAQEGEKGWGERGGEGGKGDKGGLVAVHGSLDFLEHSAWW